MTDHDFVRITDVAPRDGLQNEPRPVALEAKLELIRRLARCGLDEIEVAAFVSPRWVPQMADATEICRALATAPHEGVIHSALVPNLRGWESLRAVHDQVGGRIIDKIAVFTAASEEFSRRNTNATIAETLERFAPVIAAAHADGLTVRGYVSCVIACPFAGQIDPRTVADVSRRLLDSGVDELDWGETIGAGTPENVGALLETLERELPAGAYAGGTLHLHDTHGRASECVRAALAAGLRSFDGSAGGLGGCPYASTAGRRAPGNIATESLADVFEATGYRTRLDRAALDEAAAFARSLIGGGD